MEIAVIAVIALIVLGPNKLPEAAKSLGKGFREMRDSFQGATEGAGSFLSGDDREEEEDDDEDVDDEDTDYVPEALRSDDADDDDDDDAEDSPSLETDDEDVSLDTGSAPQEGLDEADHQNDARSSVPSASSSSTERE